MRTVDIFTWVNRHYRVINIAALPLILIMVAGVGMFVYTTGGIKYVYSHSMYVPIVLSGMVYGIRGGIIIGMLGGLVLGPYMPIDVATGEMQQTVNWLYRAGFFTLIGALSGIASDTVRSYVRHLFWLSRHDVATRLPNRLALMDDLSVICRQSPVNDNVLLILSLQSASELKAAFGHEVIESIIQQTALRFNHVLTSQGEIYRADTEQVSALISDTQPDAIQGLLGNLNLSARHPFVFEGIPVHIEARMGYVAFRECNDSPAVYLQQAESAVNVAHKSLLEVVQYHPSLKLETRDNVAMLGELIKAIELQQLSLHYQPKVNLSNGKVSGVEALMRWQHPTRGPIAPGKFIPCAEQSTLIHPLTRFALSEAMQTALHFQALSMPVPVAVNISAHNLYQPDFADTVFELLAEHELSGEFIELEVTEGALIHDMNHTISELNKLANGGVVISVDDFGTGYSSLQYLHKLPISHLKIDQSFVHGLPDDKDAVHIVEASVSLAHKMGMKTVAEGVENQTVMTSLMNMGCDVAQGYYISRPINRNAYIDWHNAQRGQFDWQPSA